MVLSSTEMMGSRSLLPRPADPVIKVNGGKIMTDKMVNGILFIIAGLGPFVVYIGLGETGIVSMAYTEKIAAYVLLTWPLAFMMTRNNFIDAGFNNSCCLGCGNRYRCH